MRLSHVFLGKHVRSRKGRVCIQAMIAVLLLPVVPTVATAQDGSIPDTLDWRRYFPLEVGDQWQYRDDYFGFVYYTRWHIRTDTLIDGKEYFIIDAAGYDGDLQPIDQHRRTDIIRYSASNPFIVKRAMDEDESPVEVWWLDIPCGLDAPFNARYECTDPSTGMEYFIDGTYNASILIGNDVVQTAAVKLFDSLGGGWTLAADIGLVGSVVEGASPVTTLIYAHVNDTTYGEAAVPTDTETAYETPSRLAIVSVYPNPFSTSATVHYQLRTPGPITVAVYDMLGRRVREYTDAWNSPGLYQTVIDGEGLRAGTYLVRLTAPSGEQYSRAIMHIK